ncbi:MAG: hypothetical protein KAW09_03440 [Thermoplasmata archaeon]|nr:hypothetical protein [Thermoplasmata archaeon]
MAAFADVRIGMDVSLELLAIGVIVTTIFFLALLRGVTKGAVGYALIAIGLLFIILAFDPM